MVGPVLVACLTLVTGWLLTASAPAWAGDSSADARPSLKRWTVAIQWAASGRDDYTIFGRDGLPPAEVTEPAQGVGLSFGFRFGERFVLALQTVWRESTVDAPETFLVDGEILVTGTVLFRPYSTLQPFVRGGLGGSGLGLRNETQNVYAFGPSATGGAGFQLKVARWLSFDFEAAAVFTNYMQVKRDRDGDDTTETWNVRTSNIGFRWGIGLHIWF